MCRLAVSANRARACGRRRPSAADPRQACRPRHHPRQSPCPPRPRVRRPSLRRWSRRAAVGPRTSAREEVEHDRHRGRGRGRADRGRRGSGLRAVAAKVEPQAPVSEPAVAAAAAPEPVPPPVTEPPPAPEPITEPTEPAVPAPPEPTTRPPAPAKPAPTRRTPAAPAPVAPAPAATPPVAAAHAPAGTSTGTAEPDPVSKAVEAALPAMERGQFDAALTGLQSALGQRPTSPNASQARLLDRARLRSPGTHRRGAGGVCGPARDLSEGHRVGRRPVAHGRPGATDQAARSDEARAVVSRPDRRELPHHQRRSARPGSNAPSSRSGRT